jgi:hypothetical protein
VPRHIFLIYYADDVNYKFSIQKIVLTVRNAKFGSLKGFLPPIALKLLFTHSGTALIPGDPAF